MPKKRRKGGYEHRRISVDNARRQQTRTDEWWEACSRVDVDALRASIVSDVFAVRRAYRLHYFGGRMLEAWEREALKALVAKEQKARWKRWVPQESGWKRRGVYFD